LVTLLDLELDDLPPRRRRHFHGGLARVDFHQGVTLLKDVPGGHFHLQHAAAFQIFRERRQLDF
jgi:hypothetical protein